MSAHYVLVVGTLSHVLLTWQTVFTLGEVLLSIIATSRPFSETRALNSELTETETECKQSRRVTSTGT